MLILYRAVSLFADILEVLIIVRIVFSWFQIGPYNPLGRLVYELTEPILSLTRELLYRLNINTGMFDFSPIVAIFILRLILSLLRAIIF